MSVLRAMDASNAYSQALGKGASAVSGGNGMSAREALSGGNGFGDMLKSVVTDVSQVTKVSEKAAVAGLNRQMDLTDVVSAVSNAEMVLDTVVAVRDKVIQAYQEIVRMPI
ncbi:flagellar hook-basal body complex protein FliE [Govanella unica]|uniref:Flagellar hook-basal body complex protein FliE n=1 Tax=Govanella unica TaxID=2975056 RepID=A0A9X3Z6P5_9PROT|nr:flagellar hook-basal body complex protein FliE [Govania unica]MDA5193233.1 flagellar hook-basal body complex protein FliE [Govania unica]